MELDLDIDLVFDISGLFIFLFSINQEDVGYEKFLTHVISFFLTLIWQFCTYILKEFSINF